MPAYVDAPYILAIDLMTEPLEDITVRPPNVLVLAQGATAHDVNQRRGHLFEQFVARLLERLGYMEPTTDRLNVSVNGIELDVTARHRVSSDQAIVECKAYSASLRTDHLTKFYGKLSAERIRGRPNLFGLFVAIPDLVSEADEWVRSVSPVDPHFRVLRATEVVDLIRDLKLINSGPPTDLLLSDPAIVITEYGIHSAAKELDRFSRLPLAIRVWTAAVGPVPDPVTRLLASSPYAADAPVLMMEAASAPPPVTEPYIAQVVGSSSDFEYQLPAAPQFFVGRKALIEDFSHMVRDGSTTGTIVVLNAQSGWGKSSLSLRLKGLVERDHGVGLAVDTRTATSPQFIPAVLRFGLLQAEQQGLLAIPKDAAYGSVTSALDTIRRSKWRKPNGQLLLIFDQFENVFRDLPLTRAFRDLALGTQQLDAPLIVGFAWKTDLIGFTEGHPYQLRDEIRSYAFVMTLPPFGPTDIDILLSRLQVAARQKIGRELRNRLREYSQGFPWLFKKLASHVLHEIQTGITQESLVAETLNVQRLFDSDLAQLTPDEQQHCVL
jgi:hypothetical protein